MDRKFNKMVLGLLAHITPSIFFSRILRGKAVSFTIDIFFRTAVLRKLFDIRFSNNNNNVFYLRSISIQTLKFLTRLPTRQDGVKNRAKSIE